MKLDSFNPKRVLKQGEPLSPCLFVLCMKSLSLCMDGKVKDGAWQPIKITRQGPAISHLMFADDVILFTKATEKQVKVVWSTVDDFCMGSGMMISTD